MREVTNRFIPKPYSPLLLGQPINAFAQKGEIVDIKESLLQLAWEKGNFLHAGLGACIQHVNAS
jgi:hypothetical protein